jgi:hypothetical protein
MVRVQPAGGSRLATNNRPPATCSPGEPPLLCRHIRTRPPFHTDHLLSNKDSGVIISAEHLGAHSVAQCACCCGARLQPPGLQHPWQTQQAVLQMIRSSLSMSSSHQTGDCLCVRRAKRTAARRITFAGASTIAILCLPHPCEQWRGHPGAHI